MDKDNTKIEKKKSFESILNWQDYLEKAATHCDECNRIEIEADMEDFVFLNSIGSGSFSQIFKVEYKKDKKIYAIKMLPTEFRKGQYEKFLLSCIKFHFIVCLKYFFYDDTYLFIVLPYAEGGDLFTLLRANIKFEETVSQFYAAQVLLALEYLHTLNIIYRDIKPENILLDKSGYIKLTDLGLSKQTTHRTYTLCGTPDYIAPEIILSNGYGKSVDFWSFGVLIYEFNFGVTPFYNPREIDIYKNVLKGRYEVQTYFSEKLKDILTKLLQKDISRRYGTMANGFNDIKQHGWFLGTPWLPLLNKSIDPPTVSTSSE